MSAILTVKTWQELTSFMFTLYNVLFETWQKMESLPEEMLFTIFQNLHPLELIQLSRVNQRWHNLALNPLLHRFLKDLRYFM